MRWKCNKLLRMKCEEAGCFEDEVWMWEQADREINIGSRPTLGYQQFEDAEGPINIKDNVDVTKSVRLVLPRKERAGNMEVYIYIRRAREGMS